MKLNSNGVTASPPTVDGISTDIWAIVHWAAGLKIPGIYKPLVNQGRIAISTQLMVTSFPAWNSTRL